MTQEVVIPLTQRATELRWPYGGWFARVMRWVQRLTTVPALGASLRVEARLNLGPKKSLVLVNCQERQVLLALSGDTIATVMEITDPARNSQPAKVSARRTSMRKGAGQ
jgi:flagellar biogenesis protein FliO